MNAVRAALAGLTEGLPPQYAAAAHHFIALLVADALASPAESARTLARATVLSAHVLTLARQRCGWKFGGKGTWSGAAGAPQGGRATRVVDLVSYATQHMLRGSVWHDQWGRIVPTGLLDAAIPRTVMRRPDLTVSQALAHFTAFDAAPFNSHTGNTHMHGGAGTYLGPSPAEQRAQNRDTGARLLIGAKHEIILVRGGKGEEVIAAVRAAAATTGHALFDATPPWVALARASSGAQDARQALGLARGTASWAFERTPPHAASLLINTAHACATLRLTHSKQPTSDARDVAVALRRLHQTLLALHGGEPHLVEATDSTVSERYKGWEGWLVRGPDGVLDVLWPPDDYNATTREEAAARAGVDPALLVSVRSTWGNKIKNAFVAFETARLAMAPLAPFAEMRVLQQLLAEQYSQQVASGEWERGAAPRTTLRERRAGGGRCAAPQGGVAGVGYRPSPSLHAGHCHVLASRSPSSHPLPLHPSRSRLCSCYGRSPRARARAPARRQPIAPLARGPGEARGREAS